MNFAHRARLRKRSEIVPLKILGNDCNCRDWHGCIMAQSIVGLENVQPYKFSECSKTDYIEALKSGHGFCLFNKPNEVKIRNIRCIFSEIIAASVTFE